MPTGSVTLLEGAKSGSNVLKRGFVETLVTESPILEMLPFMEFAGNALEVDIEVSLPNPAFRNVNETYTRSWGTDTSRFFGVAILGGEVFVDNYIIKVQNNVASTKAKQYRKFGKAMSRTFDEYFFDGTGESKTFKGLNTLISEGLGTAEAAGANGATLTLAMLDQADDSFRGQASPTARLMNRTLRRKVTALARETYSGISLIDVGTDVFGRQVTMYNDVPIRIIGDTKAGAAILDFDETQGSSNVTSSIYTVAFGTDENVYGLSGLGGSLEVKDFGEIEAEPGHLGRVEWYPGVAIDNPFSVHRLTGVTNT